MTPRSIPPAPKSLIKELALRLGAAQREAQRHNIPTLVIIEGLDAADKGKLLNQILLEIDARAFNLYSTHASQQEPRRYPLLRRFWNNTPAGGMIQFYDRSAYYLVLDAWAEGKLHDDELESYWKEINAFERQLHESNVQIIKLFLTIPKKEQSKRFKELESNPKTAWRVTKKDWRRHHQYRSYLNAAKAMMKKTAPDYAKWHRVDTMNFQGALIETYNRIIDKLQLAIEKSEATEREQKSSSKKWIPYKGKNFLSEVTFDRPMDRSLYKKTLKKRQAAIYELMHEVHAKKLPVVIVFCGWDAAGKGGCIKRLVQSIDPRGYNVVPIAAPTKLELDHHYLWRFWKEMPPRGQIAIFDRSWYGRVLVERVEALCSNLEWQRSYHEINEMETHLARFGTSIVKFWLQIDKVTQLERFEVRKTTPLKQWKITDEDWRNREKWDLYEESVNEMLERTNTKQAPWVVVPANCKMTARIKTLDTIIKTLSKALKK